MTASFEDVVTHGGHTGQLLEKVVLELLVETFKGTVHPVCHTDLEVLLTSTEVHGLSQFVC